MATDTQTQPRLADSPQHVRHTKVPTLVFRTARDVDKHVALVFESLIRENNSAGVQTVLGLPTGSTPIGVYRELIRLHQQDDLDFSRVVTFNLDEYWPIEHTSLQSYNRWMRETFFDHINIPEENIHIPPGDIPRHEVENFCEAYERAIEKAGGIDLQLLGIGRSGHIGFNEPGSWRNSSTRLVPLDPVTRRDAASDFFGEENVPSQAITMGVGTILSARKIIMMALGEHKAPIVHRAVEGEVTEDITASFLQTHPNAILAVDQAAAGDLTAIRVPWLTGAVNWTSEMQKRAVIWLSQTTETPLLKLAASDFMENQLYDLVREHGPTEAIVERVFHEMLQGICTQPAGETPQTVLVFSPHPDDDVISMGGTLITLAEQGHDVHVAYMTSGNIAVFDHDAMRHIEYVRRFHDMFDIDATQTAELCHRLTDMMRAKLSGEGDSDELLAVKGLIRRTEATAAAQTAGVGPDRLRFLDLPFYQTGHVTKRPISDEDVEIVANLLRELNPGQIYVAGDLSDPHGTHRVCAQTIIDALKVVKNDQIQPEVWLYRGAWQEYEPHEIERAVPLSPAVTQRKKSAIFNHESQKDRALFPGHDEREFWVRAEERTKNTARIYNELGLPEYFALEGFVRFTGQL